MYKDSELTYKLLGMHMVVFADVTLPCHACMDNSCRHNVYRKPCVAILFTDKGTAFMWTHAHGQPETADIACMRAWPPTYITAASCQEGK